MRFRAAKVVAVGLFVALAGCSPIYTNHGYIPPQEELNELTVGVDKRAKVDDLVGAPTSSGVLSDGDYYYIRSRIKAVGPRRPQVVERQVLAISFAPDDTISGIARYSLADGRVVPISRRVTDPSVENRGFIRQLFGNIGNVNPVDSL